MKIMISLIVLLTFTAYIEGYKAMGEHVAHHNRRPHNSKFLKVMDGDHDGFVELYDVARLLGMSYDNPVLKSTFYDADVNGDYKLDETELQQLLNFDRMHQFFEDAEAVVGAGDYLRKRSQMTRSQMTRKLMTRVFKRNV